MNFKQTKLSGAYVIEPERHEDERGFFARTWCRREFEDHGLAPYLAQCSISFNKKRGTLRGMHFQAAPHEEAKLVRCTSGAVYDVIIDLRPESPTYTEHMSVVLSSNNYTMLYVPEGFAHGFQTIEDNAEVFYQMSTPFAPDYARGVRWNDSLFGIEWPDDERTINERDRNYPDFTPETLLATARHD